MFGADAVTLRISFNQRRNQRCHTTPTIAVRLRAVLAYIVVGISQYFAMAPDSHVGHMYISYLTIASGVLVGICLQAASAVQALARANGSLVDTVGSDMCAAEQPFVLPDLPAPFNEGTAEY